MRKLISKKDSEKKAKKMQLIGGSVLMLVMLLSTIGYSLNVREKTNIEKIVYQDKTFVKENGFWNLQIEDFKFSFLYSPKEVPVFDSEIDYLNQYDNVPVYVYSDNPDAITELTRNLVYNNKIVQRIQPACLDEESCNGEYPIKTCEDRFIIIREANSSSLKQDNKCIFISGKAENLIKLSDSFLLKIIGLQ